MDWTQGKRDRSQIHLSTGFYGGGVLALSVGPVALDTHTADVSLAQGFP